MPERDHEDAVYRDFATFFVAKAVENLRARGLRRVTPDQLDRYRWDGLVPAVEATLRRYRRGLHPRNREWEWEWPGGAWEEVPADGWPILERRIRPFRGDPVIQPAAYFVARELRERGIASAQGGTWIRYKVRNTFTFWGAPPNTDVVKLVAPDGAVRRVLIEFSIEPTEEDVP
jgi:hypothetical protein